MSLRQTWRPCVWDTDLYFEKLIRLISVSKFKKLTFDLLYMVWPEVCAHCQHFVDFKSALCYSAIYYFVNTSLKKIYMHAFNTYKLRNIWNRQEPGNIMSLVRHNISVKLFVCSFIFHFFVEITVVWIDH